MLTIVRLLNRLCAIALTSASLMFASMSIRLDADDWPQWRGPNRDAICRETGLLKQWPTGGPPLAWKATGLGSGYSSVSVVGDRIFSFGDMKDSSYVFCREAKDGSEVWKTKVGKVGGNYPGTRSTPTVDHGLVFVLGQFGDLVCVKVKDGTECWRKNLISDFGGKLGKWNYAESPLVDGEQVICTPGGTKGAMVALDRLTGTLKWQTTGLDDYAAYVSAIVVEIGGVRQYVQLTGESLIGVGTDGKVLWKADRHSSTAVTPTPVYHDGKVFVSSGSSGLGAANGIGCNLFKISSIHGVFSATQVYANTNLANYLGGFLVSGGCIFGHSDNGGMTCMDFKSGAVKWQTKNVGKGAVLLADGHLYCRNEAGLGTMVLIEANPEAYVEKGRFDQPDRQSKLNNWAHPVIANGRLYLRDQGLLLCYNIKAR
jgi:outer membrane protein assembly factor BamB